MKKKIIAMCLVVALAATAIIGGTLAYFTDTDKEDNVFTMGNVQIDLEEEFDQNSKLIPGIDVNKDVWVKNVGTEDAFVRVHIAIPTALDDGNPNFAAVNNFLHFNFTYASVAAGQWSWLPKMTDGVGYNGNGNGNWNFYSKQIGSIQYNIYVVTYRTALKPNEGTSTNALDKVYMDASVDCEVTKNAHGITTVTYKDNKGHSYTPPTAKDPKILVFAEGVQAAGFDDPYEAFDKAFGKIGSYNPWEK